MFPIAYWFRNELYDFVKNFLLDSSLLKIGLFRQKAILDLLEAHRHGRADHHVRLWMLLNLALWYQLFIEQEDLAQVQARVTTYLHQTTVGADVA